MLEISVLGAPEVHDRGQLLSFPTRKTLALLIYLVVEGGSQTREKLVTLFWPEADARHGRTVLRTTLAYLRHTLLLKTTATAVVGLRAGRDALAFNLDSAVRLDYAIVARAWQLAQKPLGPSTAPILRRDQPIFQDAVRLYRGPFLEGFSLGDAPDFDDWVASQRETCRRRLSRIFECLADLLALDGQLSAGIELATRWIAHDPLDEAAYRSLMTLQRDDGNRAAALQVFETCRALLDRELKTKPSRETLALANQLRALTGTAPIRRRRADAHPFDFAHSPLVGREAELQHLRLTYAAAARGETRIVVLEGDAGIGKTRLASEFTDWVATQGNAVLAGAAFETSGRLPFQSLVDAFRGRLDWENALDDLLDDVWLTELSRLFPEIQERYPELVPPPSSDASAPARLLEALARLSEVLAARQPLVLFLDGVQWVDAATLDALRYVIRRLAAKRCPFLVLLAVRSEALARSGSPTLLTDWLAELRREAPESRIVLGPLGARDTTQLVWSVQPEAIFSSPDLENAALRLVREPDDLAEWIFAETEGQPLFVLETLKALLERQLIGWVHRLDGGWALSFTEVAQATLESQWLIAPGVRDVIQSRLSSLSADSVAFLTAAAVLGYGFTFPQVSRVSGMSDAEALGALDQILELRLLRQSLGHSSHGGEAGYDFSHDRLRNVVFAGASEARRRLYHRRALTCLRDEHAPAARLLEHAFAAGLISEVVALGVAAGDDAMRVFAVRDAVAQYERARLAAQDPAIAEGDPDLLGHLYSQLGRGYELLDHHEKARAVYESMLQLAREMAGPHFECVALNRLGILLVQSFSGLSDAMALLEQASDAARRGGNPLDRAETEWSLAQTCFYSVDPLSCIRHAQTALVTAHEYAVPDLVGRCLNVLAYAHWCVGQPSEIALYAEEARSLYAATGNRALEADSLCLIGIARLAIGKMTDAVTCLRAARRIVTEIDNAWGQANIAYHLALALLGVGQYGEARELAETALRISRDVDFLPLRGCSLIALGSVQRALFNFDRARELHLEAIGLKYDTPIRLDLEGVAGEACADCAAVDDWTGSFEYAWQASQALSDSIWPIFGHALGEPSRVVEALLRGGADGAARQFLRRFADKVGDVPRYQIPCHRAKATLLAWDGDLASAVEHSRKAASLAEDFGLRGEQWRILAELAQLLRALGENGEADRCVGRAQTILREIVETLPDGPTRTRFLAAEQVRDLLGDDPKAA